MARKDGLVRARRQAQPDAKVMSAEPLHPAFTAFISFGGVRALEAQRLRREARRRPLLDREACRRSFKQEWSYDVTFSAPITLDPAAKTMPKK
jgi:hypothetical protein